MNVYEINNRVAVCFHSRDASHGNKIASHSHVESILLYPEPRSRFKDWARIQASVGVGSAEHTMRL